MTTTSTAPAAPITVGDTVRLRAAFCRSTEVDLRATVTELDGGAIAATVHGTGRQLKIAAQAFELAECTDCRYTRGHASWCRLGDGSPSVTDAERAAVDASIAAAQFTLAEVAELINDARPLSVSHVEVEHLGGNVYGVLDLDNGLGLTIDDGQRELDTNRDGAATVIVWREDEPEVEVLNAEARTAAEVAALFASVTA